MKLIIVDDEKITRSGLISSINWEQLGIDKVIEASDGSEGLRLCLAEKPDIILTDMRMPRMDGVTMTEKLREDLPDSAVIFMSGYSDREYLKAAIHLKAVSYVEKPLDTSEVSEAIRLAAEHLSEKGLVKRGRSVELAENESRLVELMTHVPEPHTFDEVPLPEPMTSDDHFTALIIELAGDTDTSRMHQASLDLAPFFARHHLNEIHFIKENCRVCYFVYGSRDTGSALPSLCSDIKRFCEGYDIRCLVIGDTCHGILHAYESYTSAVVLLQQAFFCDSGTILANTDEMTRTPSIIRDCSGDYASALESGNMDSAIKVLDEIRSQFMPPCRLLPSQVKDIYYQLFLLLQKAARKSQLSEIMLKGDQSIYDMVENAESLNSLHEELSRCSSEYFEGLSSRDTGSNMVFAIKEFIRQNYQNESLSIKSVSDHVNRSATYVCTFFKGETGLTLNQYITGYRIERAQEMLSDPRYKITDVAARVGYADVNYFGKIFKKVTNVSPSEFRSSLSSGRESYPS